MSKKIILTGGGTAGHVTPNMALIPELKKKGYGFFKSDNLDEEICRFIHRN